MGLASVLLQNAHIARAVAALGGANASPGTVLLTRNRGSATAKNQNKPNGGEKTHLISPDAAWAEPAVGHPPECRYTNRRSAIRTAEFRHFLCARCRQD